MLFKRLCCFSETSFWLPETTVTLAMFYFCKMGNQVCCYQSNCIVPLYNNYVYFYRLLRKLSTYREALVGLTSNRIGPRIPVQGNVDLDGYRMGTRGEGRERVKTTIVQKKHTFTIWWFEKLFFYLV